MKWYHNLKFRWKVALVCLIAGMLPMLLLGNFCYIQIRSLLQNREERTLEDTLTQAVSSLSQRLDGCQNALTLAAWDKDLGQAAERVYWNNFEMYATYQYVVEPLFLLVQTVNPNILATTLYTSANLYPHGSTVRPVEEAESLPWFKEAQESQKPFLYTKQNEEDILFISPVYSANGAQDNYIVMQADYDAIFSPLDTLWEGAFGVILLDADGKEVYAYQKDGQAHLTRQSLESEQFQSEYLASRRQIESTGWQMILYRPIHTVYANTQTITLTVLLVAGGCTLLLSILAQLLSLAVVRPLEDLSRNMQAIGEGDLSLTILPEPDRADEVGQLLRQFAEMVKQLQYMINEVYKNRIARQEYEMKALQAQINPHFFYNSLSLINSKAIIAGQEDISQMAQLLSTFYRTTLNHGQSAIPVSDEWTNTLSYVHIQLMMHRGSFDVIEHLDPQIRDYMIPNLLLQPLAENAIAHGIDHKITPGRGRLEIRGELRGEYLEFTVADNGCGIEPGKLFSLLTTESKGYGVQNVHRRIKLYYGEEYGLSYESSENSGTTATLVLPAMLKLPPAATLER